MALKANINTQDNFGRQTTLNDCYVKIINVAADKLRAEMLVGIWNSDQSVRYEIKKYEFNSSVENGSENFIKQGYVHLKTLPEFEGATDC
jgi:hypothetical protein